MKCDVVAIKPTGPTASSWPGTSTRSFWRGDVRDIIWYGILTYNDMVDKLPYHGGGFMSRAFSVSIGVLISVILVKPDVLLWIPALNSPHVDTNVGVITILLAVWTIIRESLRERESLRQRERLQRDRADFLREMNERLDNRPNMRRAVTESNDVVTTMVLHGAVIVASIWFFVRLFVG